MEDGANKEVMQEMEEEEPTLKMAEFLGILVVVRPVLGVAVILAVQELVAKVVQQVVEAMEVM